MDRDEPHLLADPVVAENFGDKNVAVGAQALGDVCHRRWNVEMKRRPQPAERRPLGKRFEIVHRLDGLDFDDRLDTPAPILGHEDDVRKHCLGARADRGVLLHSRVDTDLEATAKLGLQKADDPVVLELLADRPDEDGAHENGTITWITLV